MRRSARWHVVAIAAGITLVAPALDFAAAQPPTPPLPAPTPSVKPPPTTPTVAVQPPAPASLIPSGYLPDELHARLEEVSGGELSRACGNLESPWAFRGKAGRRMTLRDYGRRTASPEQARRLATLLRAQPVDTAYLAPGAVIACEAAHAPPVYLVRFSGGPRPTFALVRFDIAAIVLFDSELPLGLIAMGDHADTLWRALGAFFEDDPAFRAPRPAPGPLRGRGAEQDTSAGGIRPDYVFVTEYPAVLQRVQPVYPQEARRTNTQGTVQVHVLIGTDGAVRDAVVRAGPPVLRDAALDAIWHWRFRPAVNAGRPIAVWALIPVKFSLH